MMLVLFWYVLFIVYNIKYKMCVKLQYMYMCMFIFTNTRIYAHTYVHMYVYTHLIQCHCGKGVKAYLNIILISFYYNIHNAYI